MKITIQNKEYNLKTDYKEITLIEANQLLKLEVPETLSALYEAKTSEEYNDLYSKLTSKELIKTHPRFFGKVLSILADVPGDVIELVSYEDRISIYTDFCEQSFIDIYYLNPRNYISEGLIQFVHKDVTYHFPKTLNIFGSEIPMYKEKAMAFTEEADIMVSLKGLQGADGIAQFCAVMCRERGEDYDEYKAIERAKLFADLPMDIVWEVFFYTIKQLNISLNTMSTYFQNLPEEENQKEVLA